jgi:hypothetical protein
MTGLNRLLCAESVSRSGRVSGKWLGRQLQVVLKQDPTANGAFDFT